MNAWKHFCTITKHRHKVIRNCWKAGIPVRGLLHDLSKYSPVEFIAGAKYYQGHRSPNTGERDVNGYSLAWMHHKGRNRHHFEYWTDYSNTGKGVVPVKMPLKFVIEMFCDRVAASKTYMGEAYTDQAPLEYFINGKANRSIHAETAKLLERLLVMLAEEGEDKTFTYIRKLLKKGTY